MYKVGVFAFILDESERILLVKNAYGNRFWAEPGGGVENGEDPHDAIRREVKEETGLLTQIHKLLGVYHYVDINNIVYHFLCSATGETKVTNSSEISDVRWFDINLLPEHASKLALARIRDATISTNLVLRVVRGGHV